MHGSIIAGFHQDTSQRRLASDVSRSLTVGGLRNAAPILARSSVSESSPIDSSSAPRRLIVGVVSVWRKHGPWPEVQPRLSRVRATLVARRREVNRVRLDRGR
jgi:hypothetical protein